MNIEDWNGYTVSYNYLKFIDNILLNNNNVLFNDFKQNKDFCDIIGCDNDRDAISLCKTLINGIKQYKYELYDINKLKYNDTVGSPKTIDTEFGQISPTTLRYILSSFEIVNNFENMNNKNILEIGGGYGGQAVTLSNFINWKSYTFIDLPNVIELVKKYVNEFQLKNVFFQTLNDYQQQSFDLIISSYALTEFNINGFDFYMDNFIKNSNNIYIRSNVSDKNIKPHMIKRLLEYFDINFITDISINAIDGIWIGKNKR